MKLKELISFDQNLKIVKNPEWPEEILAISALDGVLPNSLVFIKNAKFLQKLLPFKDQVMALKVGVIFDEKFYHLLPLFIKCFGIILDQPLCKPADSPQRGF